MANIPESHKEVYKEYQISMGDKGKNPYFSCDKSKYDACKRCIFDNPTKEYACNDIELLGETDNNGIRLFCKLLDEWEVENDKNNK